MVTTQTINTRQITNAQVHAGLMVLKAVADTVRELGEAPEGPIYAALMDRMDLATFESLVRTLVGSGLIEKRGHLLVWVG